MLDFSFGNSHAGGTGLSGFVARNAGSPLAGHLTPTCDGGGGVDCGALDYREPVAFIPLDGTGSPLPGAMFWVEVNDDRTSVLLQGAYNAFSTVSVSGTEVFETAPCHNIAHPSVVAFGSTSVLLFACDDEIMAVPLSSLFVPLGTPAVLTTEAALGFSLGIVDLDATVRVRGPVTTFQLWVAGRDARGITRLALAEGSGTGTGLPLSLIHI